LHPYCNCNVNIIRYFTIIMVYHGGLVIKHNSGLAFIIVFLFSTSLFFSGCIMASTPKLKVVTSTSLLTYITEQVGGDRVEVFNLIPPAQHPGNFNIRPGDIQALASANLFLLHGWPGEGYADKLVAAANNPDLIVAKAGVEGNWMIPPVQTEAIDKVLAILNQVDRKGASIYAKSAEQYRQRVNVKEAEIKSKLQKISISQVNVIASQRQADFLTWAGFKVVSSYAGPNSLNPQSVKELVDKGRQSKVLLVVDNLQDGKGAGKAIAEDIGAKQVDLSNFPGGLENSETWEKAIDRNVELLLSGLGK
jgi:zinc transport system substrate-binding protein